LGQAGLWDVDGSGIQKINDPSLAEALRIKVEAFNLRTVLTCVLATMAFSAIPL